ncbi:MAG: hypothetical protein PVJ53_06780, partial [Desulfobacterales bacterium]
MDEPMLTSAMAYIALGVCLGGLLWRIGGWFRRNIGPESDALPVGRRIAASASALMRTLFSRRIVQLTGILLWDICLQGRLLRRDRSRWAIHMALSYGFLLLVFMHALDDWTAPYLGADYASTLNPYRWLRNFLAALVLVGALGIAWRHRAQTTWPRIRPRADRLVVPLLAVIIVSGVFLESTRILSPTIFNEMVDDYMGN